MSCNLTLGRLEPCKDKVGGLRAVYFINYSPLAVTRANSGEDTITDFTLADGSTDAVALKYDLRGTSSFEQSVTASRENGTAFFEQTLNLTLKGLTTQTHKEFKLMAYGRPHIVVEDNNGAFWMMGEEYGCEVTGGTIVTGAAMGDLYGYTITLMASEKLPASLIECDATGLDEHTTITEGA
jgi:hypothetical protein